MKTQSSNCRFPQATANSSHIIRKTAWLNWIFQRWGTPAGASPFQIFAGRPPGRLGDGVPATKIRRWHRATAAALKNILAGVARKISATGFVQRHKFQRKVWNALRKIARGRTKSYGEIARAMGKPKAVRAVGGACGANPIPVLIPCHRVLAANKKLGGFSGGLNWKRELLAREGIKF